MVSIISAHNGIPDITVLFTSDEREAAEFIKGWEGVYHFGLDLEWKPVFQKGQYSRAATLQVCAGPWVLVFDLKAHRTKGARPLPDALWYFLENEQHTFYGQGLLEDLTRLAFEFDCIAHGIDFAQGKAWPHMDKGGGGGLAGKANRVLGTSVKQSKKLTMSNWEARPLSEQQLNYVAEDAYLSWALARSFIKAEFPHEEWLVTMSEMYGQGSKRIGVAGIIDISHSCHDWQSAKVDFESDQAEKKIAKAHKKAKKAQQKEKQTAEAQQREERAAEESRL